MSGTTALPAGAGEFDSGKFRALGSKLRPIQTALLASLTLLGAAWSLELHYLVNVSIFTEQFLGMVFAVGVSAVFLGVKTRRTVTSNRVPWYDWLAFAATIATGGYIVVFYKSIIADPGSIDPERYILGAIALLIVLEATRRLLGWALVCLAAVVTAYALTSHLFPGMLNAPSLSWQRTAVYLYLDGNSLLGLPLNVTASILIAFILFGRVLYSVNGDKLLTDFALSAMGRFRGGPAKVAVIASSFFGTISGSVVSNVVMDGPITIPMMRKSGYPAHLAAATEAVASTGGQIMPPVMGITAFLIAEFLEIPYGEVIAAALLPAVLYYVALYVQVDLESAKYGMSGLPRADLPRMRAVARRGWVFLLPIAVLIWTLVFENWRPGKSAMAAVFVTIAVGVLHRDTRPSLRRLWEAVEKTGQTILTLVVIGAIAGIVIGALQLSGLSFNFSQILVSVSSGSVVVLLAITAFVCIVLGMGMPTGVIYVMLAVLVAPALVKMGIIAISAHLFLFYFGMLSMITPPLCIATFAAAAIAETPFWRAGWAGVRLGIAAYVVPFVLVFQPGLVFEGSTVEIVATAVKSAVGVAILAVGVTGFLHGPLGIPARVLFVAASLALLWTPLNAPFAAPILIAAMALSAALFWHGRRNAVRVGVRP